MKTHGDRGAALLSALLIVALVATLVSGLFWREQVRMRFLENERLKDQAQWLGVGAVDWARLILREDLFQTGAVDHLGEVWAVPIARTPLNGVLQGQGAAVAQDEDAWLAGRIVDATSRFNLTSLVDVSAPGGDGGWVVANGINTEAVGIFARLLQGLGLDPAGAGIVAQYLLTSRPPVSATADTGLPPLVPQDLLHLLPGVTPSDMENLSQYLVVLRRPTPVNANTASPLLLAALLGVDAGTANLLVQDRSQAFFTDYNALITRLNQRAPRVLAISARNLNVASEYFWVVEQLHLGRVTLRQQVLVSRRSRQGETTRVLWIRPGWPDGVTLGG